MRLKGSRRSAETTAAVDLTTDSGEPKVTLSWDHHGGLEEPMDEGLATHLYVTLLRYARLGGTLEARGDLCHHVVEDVAILLGDLLGREAQGNVRRFADRTLPMDDALVHVALDAGGRPYYVGQLEKVSPLWEHALRSLTMEAKFTLHVHVLAGTDPHHVLEAALKGVGLCLAEALAPSDRLESTKGRVRHEADAP